MARNGIAIIGAGMIAAAHASGDAESFGFMIHEFLPAIAAGRSLEEGSIEDGYRASQILDAIQPSSVQNEPVTINLQD